MTSPRTTRRATTRVGLTLSEVLVAMGILAVGLLGVAAVFPVGGFYMQSGDVADRGNSIAQAALADAMIRGHLDPQNWVVHDINNQEWDVSNAGYTDADGSRKFFIELLSGEYQLNTSLTVERRLGLRDAIAFGSTYRDGPFGATEANGFAYRSAVFGDAFVIDPIGMAGALTEDRDDIVTDATTTISSPARQFPGFVGPVEYQSASWTPWADPAVNSSNPSAFWPVRRVTTKLIHPTGLLNHAALDTAGTHRLQQTIANELFSTSDDLAQFFPTAGDEPVRQRWETWDNGTTSGLPSVRQSRGDYSWILSVAPASAEARDAIANAPDAYPVEVSAAVFYKRTRAFGPQDTADAERLVRARVVSVNPGGGELLLTRRPAPPVYASTDPPTEPETSPFEDLRVGQYVMVVGPHPQSFVGGSGAPSRPRLALRWCRVLGVEDAGSPRLADGSNYQLSGEDQVLVAFRGPDWPWRPAMDASGDLDFSDTNLLTNDLRVAILPGVVAVHTKTMRLESGSAWSID